MTTIRHGGPCGLRIEMRAAERDRKYAGFLCHSGPAPMSHAQRGGCDMLKSSNAAKPLSSICLIPLWLAALKRRGSLRTREGEKDESDPPKTGGDLRPFVEVRCDTYLYSAPGGRSRPHLSLREGLEQPPRSWFFQGVDAALDSSLFWRRLQRPGTRTGLGP